MTVGIIASYHPLSSYIPEFMVTTEEGDTSFELTTEWQLHEEPVLPGLHLKRLLLFGLSSLQLSDQFLHIIW